MEKTDFLIEKSYHLIKKKIISLEYMPGQKLDINKLKDEIGFSLSPIKIATYRLRGEGYLTILPRKGTFVTEISRDEIMALMDYRLVLERGAVYLAIEKITQPEILRLRTLKQEMGKLKKVKDFWRLVELDNQFHLGIIQAAKNQKLTDTYTQLGPHFKMIRFRYILQKGWWTNKMEKEHLQILKAIEKRNYKAAQDAITHHILRTKQEFYGNDFGTSSVPVASLFKL